MLAGTWIQANNQDHKKHKTEHKKHKFFSVRFVIPFVLFVALLDREVDRRSESLGELIDVRIPTLR